MPKILISEKDFTSPGIAGDYSNYAVLIAGFKGEGKNPSVEPDSNGVYEFTSAQDFIDTIGEVAPKREDNAGEAVIYHYGNQMAYELLVMGYPIIYLPIDSVEELTNANTWEKFKDKASYDFRFITHGLLESSDVVDKEAYEAANQRLAAVEADIKALENIRTEIEQESNTEFETEEEYYESLLEKDAGFKDASGTVYVSYEAACAGTENEKAALENEIKSLSAGGVTTEMINNANRNIANLAMYCDSTSNEIPGRGDCVALLELDENLYTDNYIGTKAEELIINAVNELHSNLNEDSGRFCAVTVPSVHYKMTDKAAFGNNKKFPGSFHYLACFISSLKSGFAEWYAAAGYTRGVSSYVIDHTSVKFGEIAINALEPRNRVNEESSPKFACNVIANFRGSYYLWGNRTAHKLGSIDSNDRGDLVASHFLNIRQLCTTIKKQLYVSCRRFTFDPNSDTLWVNFVNSIRPTLETMKADQGIRDYKILKVHTDKKATLKAKIRIIPIEAVEDFDLEISLEDSFGETAITAGDIQ